MIAYPIGVSGQRLVFSDPILSRFRRWRQVRWYQREAGGQLFARFEAGRVLIVAATGPRWSDRRARHAYEPDRRAERREIQAIYLLGLHFVGDWHTHAEPIPTPSTLDIESMTDAFRRSTHALRAFVLVVVGQAEAPEGLYVSVCDDGGSHKLSPCAET